MNLTREWGANSKNYKSFFGDCKILILCFMIIIMGISCNSKIAISSNGVNSSPSGLRKQSHLTSEILVRFKPGTDPDTIKSIQDKLGLVTIRVLNVPDLYLMKIISEKFVEETIRDLKKYDEVLYAEPDREYQMDNQ